MVSNQPYCNINLFLILMSNLRIFSFLSLLTACVMLVSCGNEPTLSLNPVLLQLKVGDIQTIGTVGSTANVEWVSSDEEVATVYYGVVTAKSIGSAVITAKSGKASANCQVYVLGTDGASLRVSPPLVNMKAGETYQLRYGNTYNLPMTWSSSAPEIATVSSEGLVSALKPGNAVITLATDKESVEAQICVEHTWGEYALVWSDEFDGSALDESVWGYNTGGGGWGNNELQYYTSRTDNVRVEDGYLKIEAKKEDYDNRHYTSGRILSRDKKTFTYGRFEARIKFPGGQGTWPAFWMMGNKGSWPACGEIDIIEHVGSIPNRASFALHTPQKNGTKGNNWAKTTFFDYSLADDFHVYAVEWAQEEKSGKDVIRFFVDGVQYAEQWETEIDNAQVWPFNKEHFIILNLAIGGNMGGQVDDTIFDSERIMYVDWVRVYQRQEK